MFASIKSRVEIILLALADKILQRAYNRGQAVKPKVDTAIQQFLDTLEHLKATAEHHEAEQQALLDAANQAKTQAAAAGLEALAARAIADKVQALISPTPDAAPDVAADAGSTDVAASSSTVSGA